eukprot:m.33059 g.33059  ORF g.33059 m.33059 type:complete len:208 (-) comp9832_c0_seq1:136-759(-)
MAHGRGFTAIVYAIFVFLALILVAFSISLPTWILSDTSDGACGPFTYSNDRSNINDVALWDKLVKDNPVVFWLASSVCLLLAGVLLLAGFVFISFQACLPTKLLGLTRFLLLLCVVLEVASACLFASGLGNATVDASDDPINSVVFAVCPCEESGPFQTGTCGIGAGNLLVGVSVLVTFVSTMIGFLTFNSTIAKVHPFSNEDSRFL